MRLNQRLARVTGAFAVAVSLAAVMCAKPAMADTADGADGATTATPVRANDVFSSGLVASVGADALAHVTGNYGVNIAAGTGNQQSNTLTIVRNEGSTASGGSGNDASPASVTVNETQTVGGGHLAGTTPARVMIASLGAGAFANSVGNIGVNIAAGNGNIQQNVIISH
jgi:hypothetical protein